MIYEDLEGKRVLVTGSSSGIDFQKIINIMRL